MDRENFFCGKLLQICYLLSFCSFKKIFLTILVVFFTSNLHENKYEAVTTWIQELVYLIKFISAERDHNIHVYYILDIIQRWQFTT